MFLGNFVFAMCEKDTQTLFHPRSGNTKDPIITMKPNLNRLEKGHAATDKAHKFIGHNLPGSHLALSDDLAGETGNAFEVTMRPLCDMPKKVSLISLRELRRRRMLQQSDLTLLPYHEQAGISLGGAQDERFAASLRRCCGFFLPAQAFLLPPAQI